MTKPFLISMCAASLAVACGGTTSAGPADAAPSDGASPSDAAGDADPDAGVADTGSPGDGGAACNALVDIATPISVDEVATAPPSAQGGTFVDGTYVLTDAKIYTGTGGPTGPVGTGARITVQITGNVVEVVSDSQPKTTRSTATIVASGTSLTITDSCPDTKATAATYTATATTFTAILDAGQLPDGGGPKTLVEVFTKQ